MQLRYTIHHGFEPQRLEKLSGLRADEAVEAVRVCLTAPNLHRVIPAEDLARVFSRIVQALAGERVVRLFFPYEVSALRRDLKEFAAQLQEEGDALYAEVPPPHLPLLVRLSEKAAYSTFFGCVAADVTNPMPRWTNPTALLADLRSLQFVVVFTLYDESIELLSARLPVEHIIGAVREAGAVEGVQVYS
jgi:hypothetical protein